MNLLKVFIISLISISLLGCTGKYKNEVKTMPNIYETIYTKQPVKIDGKLDDQIWRRATSYPLFLSKDKTDSGQALQERGYSKFAWDENYFYVAAELEDSDLIAQGSEDEMHHYRYGDVFELFLKPANQSYYWELYATPAGKKSSFFWPARSYVGLPDCLEKYKCGLKIAAQCDGTLNNWQDKDAGWTAEMAMPIKDLEAFGYKFGTGHDWTVLVSRYNYSRYLNELEYSMSPQLSRTSFHLYEEYAVLEFKK